jgi:hypothetical protein
MAGGDGTVWLSMLRAGSEAISFWWMERRSSLVKHK